MSDQTPERITVGELAARLTRLPPELPVVVVYDCGCAEGEIARVEIADDREAVEIVVD